MDIIELKEEKVNNSGDRGLFEKFKRYKAYNLIRRNLREVHQLVTFVMEQQNAIPHKDIPEIKSEEALQAKVKFHHLLLLYAKWYKGESFLLFDDKQIA